MTEDFEVYQKTLAKPALFICGIVIAIEKFGEAKGFNRTNDTSDFTKQFSDERDEQRSGCMGDDEADVEL